MIVATVFIGVYIFYKIATDIPMLGKWVAKSSWYDQNEEAATAFKMECYNVFLL